MQRGMGAWMDREPMRTPAGGWRRSRATGIAETPRRWRRPQEPWEDEGEAFDGATVLEDLVLCPWDREATVRGVARFAVLRFVLQVSRPAAAPPPEDARERAATYVAVAAPPDDPERQALNTVLHRARPAPTPALAAALHAAGAQAEARGAHAGAFAYYRASYALAHDQDWPTEAARAARSLARLASAGGGHWSVKRWRRRAAVWQRRQRQPRKGRDTRDGADDGAPS